MIGKGEGMGVVRDGVRMGCNGLCGVVVVLAVAVFPQSAGGAGPAHQAFVEDGGSGSTACVNVVTFRYYLCVRADGSVYRIYY